MKLPSASVLSGVSAAVVIAAVAAGLFVLGSPAEERARRFDERRVTDLHGIAAATDLFWKRYSRLPESLEALSAEPGVQIVTADPLGSKAYGYRPLGGPRYEVCADFERESAEFSGRSAGSVVVAPIFEQGCQLCHGPLSISLEEPDEGGEPIPAHLPVRDLWTHESGRQCFQREAAVVPRGPSDAP